MPFEPSKGTEIGEVWTPSFIAMQPKKQRSECVFSLCVNSS